MSRIERKYCLISTSYLAGLVEIFILRHIWQNCVYLGDFLPMRTLCDAYAIIRADLHGDKLTPGLRYDLGPFNTFSLTKLNMHKFAPGFTERKFSNKRKQIF